MGNAPGKNFVDARADANASDDIHRVKSVKIANMFTRIARGRKLNQTSGNLSFQEQPVSSLQLNTKTARGPQEGKLIKKRAFEDSNRNLVYREISRSATVSQSSPQTPDDLVPEGENGVKRNNYDMVSTKEQGKRLHDFFTEYRLTPEVLGKGAFGEVRLAEKLSAIKIYGLDDPNLTPEERNHRELKRKSNPNNFVAVKVMEKKNMDHYDIADTRREANLLLSLKHTNVVKTLGFYENNSFFYLVMEYLDGGSLMKGISQLEDFTENDARDVMFSLVNALMSCHKKGICHRDIKPDNIMLRRKIIKKARAQDVDANEDLAMRLRRNKAGLTESTPAFQTTSIQVAKERYEVVLVDFGFAAQVRPEHLDRRVLATSLGSPLFMAPEILEKRSKYTTKCDIWSLGVFLYLMLSGDYPYGDEDIREEELKKKVLSKGWTFKPRAKWMKYSSEVQDLIKQMLKHDYKERIDIDKIFLHPWFSLDAKKISSEAVDFSPYKSINEINETKKNKWIRLNAQEFKKHIEQIETDNKDLTAVTVQDAEELADLTEYIHVVKKTSLYNKDADLEI